MWAGHETKNCAVLAHNLLLCQLRTPGPFMCVVLGIRRDVTL